MTCDGLTMDYKRDFSPSPIKTEVTVMWIAGFASEPGVVVAGLGAEDVDVARLAAGRLVSMINLLFVLVPHDLSQRIATARDALQFHVLAHPDGFTFRVADYLRLSRRIYCTDTEG